MKKLTDIDYYFITDSRLSKRGNLSDVVNAVRAGCRIVQYRDKEKSPGEMVKEAAELKKACGAAAFFLINDHVEIARAVGADGVHLGQEDRDVREAKKILGGKIIGVTVHDVLEAVEAEKNGADYVGLSPIFATGTKADAGRPCGLETIARVREAIDIPIVALGGVTKQNAPEVINAGADCVAAISAVVCSSDVEKEVGEFIRVISEARKQKQVI